MFCQAAGPVSGKLAVLLRANLHQLVKAGCFVMCTISQVAADTSTHKLMSQRLSVDNMQHGLTPENSRNAAETAAVDGRGWGVGEGLQG